MEKKVGEFELEMVRLQELNKQLSIRESNNEVESKWLEFEKFEVIGFYFWVQNLV